MSNELPLEQELNDLLLRDLWTIRQRMEAAPEGDDAGLSEYVPPSHRYLPDLSSACAKLLEAQLKAKAEIPKALEWDITQEGFAGVNPVHEIAKREPEVRRYWLVSRLALIANAVVECLENEGRPAKPVSMPKLGKYRPGQQGAGK